MKILEKHMREDIKDRLRTLKGTRQAPGGFDRLERRTLIENNLFFESYDNNHGSPAAVIAVLPWVFGVTSLMAGQQYFGTCCIALGISAAAYIWENSDKMSLACRAAKANQEIYRTNGEYTRQAIESHLPGLDSV